MRKRKGRERAASSCRFYLQTKLPIVVYVMDRRKLRGIFSLNVASLNKFGQVVAAGFFTRLRLLMNLMHILCSLLGGTVGLKSSMV
ncbi:hypothetical protein ACS0TY_026303 [Phlomoides rotata]